MVTLALLARAVVAVVFVSASEVCDVKEHGRKLREPGRSTSK